MLIVYIGIIGPLVYVKPYSPHNVGVPTYSLSIFQDTSQITKLAELRHLLHNANHPLPFATYHDDFPPVISDNVSIPSLVLAFQSVLSDIFVWSNTIPDEVSPFPFYFPMNDTRLLHSVDLPLPKKPPTLM